MKKISIIIFFLFIQTNVFSIEKQRITDDDQWSEKISALNWKNRDQVEHSTAIKKANANVLILDEEIYLDNFKDINQYNWWSFGHEAEQDTVKLIKGDTNNVLANIDLKKIDFTFLDGGHSYQTVISDLSILYKNMKGQSKVILCDDYGKESYIAEVEKAINDFTKQNNLKLNLIENRFAEIIT